MPPRRPSRREASGEPKSGRRSKRPRTSSSLSASRPRGEEQRPDPPPPAPPALVRLLRKDKKVLDYFRALQLNLSYDVEKWKKRSGSYQNQLEELRERHREMETQLEMMQSQTKSQTRTQSQSVTLDSHPQHSNEPRATDAASKTVAHRSGTATKEQPNSFDHRESRFKDNNDDSAKKKCEIGNEIGNEIDNDKPPSAAGFEWEFSSSSDDESDPGPRDDLHGTRDEPPSGPRNPNRSSANADAPAIPKPSFRFHFDRESDDDSDNDNDSDNVIDNVIDNDNDNYNDSNDDDDTKDGGSAKQIHRTGEPTNRSQSQSRSRSPSNLLAAPPGKNRVPNRIRVGWNLLRNAQDCLDEIGIELASAVVIEDHCDDDNNNNSNNNNGDDDDDDGNDSNGDNDNRGDADDSEEAAGKLRGGAANEISSERRSLSYVRRSDRAVLGDILQTVREWTKLRATVAMPPESETAFDSRTSRESPPEPRSGDSTGNSRGGHRYRHYAAFDVLRLTPCFVPVPDEGASGLETGGDPQTVPEGSGGEDRQPSRLRAPPLPQHPAVRGIDRLVEALACIDAFGSILDELDDDSAAHLSRPDNEDRDGSGADASENASAERFRVGMKHRHSMVRNWLASLEGEICDAWPAHDRSHRASNPALHGRRNSNPRPTTDAGRGDRDAATRDSAATRETPTATANARRLVLDAKSAPRLVAMADRCILARVVAQVYLRRNDPKSATDLLFRYVLSTAPSLRLEDYPNLPPAQSLCVVEAILTAPWKRDRAGRSDGTETGRSRRSTLLDHLLDTVFPMPGDNQHSLLRCFHLSIAACASIFRSRKNHEDTRISEPGLLEEAAYQRLKQRFEKARGKYGKGSWWTAPRDRSSTEMATTDGESLSFYSGRCQCLIESFLEELTVRVRSRSEGETSGNVQTPVPETTTLLAWMLPIALTVHGDGSMLRSMFSRESELFVSSPQCPEFLFAIEACAKAMRQLEIRNLDSYRALVSSPNTTEAPTVTRSMIAHLVNSIISASSGISPETLPLATISTLLGICHEVADGELALKIFQWGRLSSSQNEDDPNRESELSQSRDVAHFMDYWSKFPMVAVINLERRKDRLASFLSQAMLAGLWVLRGVIPPDRWEAMDHNNPQRHANGKNDFRGINPDLTSFIGTHAIDGSQDSPARVEQNLTEWLELGGIAANGASRYELDSLVLPRWRPNDLRAFDVHATDDPNLTVSVSPSEKACALSHVAAWRSIASSCSPTSRVMYTGYASGNPIHNKPGDDRIPPCPVSLILEDDAVLVDRFCDRLDELLRELPRDFHYCALGYARPKEAPLVDIPGCSHIKLPTMTWYLTGYLLSQSGARYLLDSLPVEGPIDAWMGRKMILASNWENEYGHRIGVGDVPHIGSESLRPALTKAEIKVCVRFRAYCASVPLCEQKVGTAVATGASANHRRISNQNWRLRDSDIVYSGTTVARINQRATRRKN